MEQVAYAYAYIGIQQIKCDHVDASIFCESSFPFLTAVSGLSFSLDISLYFSLSLPMHVLVNNDERGEELYTQIETANRVVRNNRCEIEHKY